MILQIKFLVISLHIAIVLKKYILTVLYSYIDWTCILKLWILLIKLHINHNICSFVYTYLSIHLSAASLFNTLCLCSSLICSTICDDFVLHYFVIVSIPFWKHYHACSCASISGVKRHYWVSGHMFYVNRFCSAIPLSDLTNLYNK